VIRLLSTCVAVGLVIVGCGRNWDSFEVGKTGSGGAIGTGGAAGSGGSGLGGGTCTSGSKVCPDPISGKLACLATPSPDTGCRTSSCDPCSIPNGTAACDAQGACAVGQCSSGFADCNNDASDGCESNLNSDPRHCGACGTNCLTTQGPNSVCKSGTCATSSCAPPTADCDNDTSNGCEVDTSTDPNNCAFCTNVCNLAHASSTCSASNCVVTSCTAPYANCDSTDSNGCETNVQTDVNNCGSCGNACTQASNSVAACGLGQCTNLCLGGYADCDSNMTNGCETSVATDPENCGLCGYNCSPLYVQAAACVQGDCNYTHCAAGHGDCDGNPSNGCETNLASDSKNCGSCGNTCPNGANCTASVCVTSCELPKKLCANVCVDVTSDPTHCGSCDGVCPAPANGQATCTNSVCGISCNNGYTNCSGTCVNLQTDPTHCGSCSTACSNSQCVNGTCA
jgi:hypothetical protein